MNALHSEGKWLIDTTRDAERHREQIDKLEKSDARLRLFTLRWYLKSTQGIRR